MLCSWLLQCCSAFVFNGVGVTAAHCVSLLPGFRVQAIDVVNDVACFDPEGMALPSPQEQITTLGVKVLDASGADMPFDKAGWKHFSRSAEA